MIAIETRPRVGWVVGVGVDGDGGWVGCGGGGQSYVEKPRFSFMNSIADKRIFLLSAKFTVWCPYKYRFDWFPK